MPIIGKGLGGMVQGSALVAYNTVLSVTDLGDGQVSWVFSDHVYSVNGQAGFEVYNPGDGWVDAVDMTLDNLPIPSVSMLYYVVGPWAPTQWRVTAIGANAFNFQNGLPLQAGATGDMTGGV